LNSAVFCRSTDYKNNSVNFWRVTDYKISIGRSSTISVNFEKLSNSHTEIISQNKCQICKHLCWEHWS